MLLLQHELKILLQLLLPFASAKAAAVLLFLHFEQITLVKGKYFKLK
jgi:hypothetical protein